MPKSISCKEPPHFCGAPGSPGSFIFRRYDLYKGTLGTAEAEAQPEDSEPAKKPARKSKGKKGAASTEDEVK